MEKEPKRTEPLKMRQRPQQSDSLLSLEVTNEVFIPPVPSAKKNGCGMCG